MDQPLLAAERRQKILAEVRKRGVVRTAQLARLFGVSEMTVHRDIEFLEAQGLVSKIFGGAVFRGQGDHTTVCGVCGAKPGRYLDFTVILRDGSSFTSCCPHCGLLLMGRLGKAVETAVTFDFISRQTISAWTATYVLASRAAPCCDPSVLAFREREDADRFRQGFDGCTADLDESMEWLSAAMGRGVTPQCC